MSQLTSLVDISTLPSLLKIAQFRDEPYVLEAVDLLHVLFTAWEQTASEKARYWIWKSWTTNIGTGQLWVRLGKAGNFYPDKIVDIVLDWNIWLCVMVHLGDYPRSDIAVYKDTSPYVLTGARVVPELQDGSSRELFHGIVHLSGKTRFELIKRYDQVEKKFYQVHGKVSRIRFPMFKKETA